MKRKFLLAVFSLALTISALAAPPVEEGKTIFNARCASCHNVNKIVVGPALGGVEQRHEMDWIVKFVQSSQTVIKSGDATAAALFAKFNNIPMPDHKDLSAENVKSIVEYIKGESKGGSEADKAPFPKPTKLHPAYLPLSLHNYTFFISLLVAIALLILSLLALVRVKEYERNKSAIN